MRVSAGCPGRPGGQPGQPRLVSSLHSLGVPVLPFLLLWLRQKRPRRSLHFSAEWADGLPTGLDEQRARVLHRETWLSRHSLSLSDTSTASYRVMQPRGAQSPERVRTGVAIARIIQQL